MNTHIRIYIELAHDRDAVVTALAHNGYIVKQGKEKVGSSNKAYVEFWKE